MMRNKVFTAARDAVSQKPTQVFYTNPIALARILCSLFLGVVIAVYATLFLQMPFAEAIALALPLLPLVGVGILLEIGIAMFLTRSSPIRIDDTGITVIALLGLKRTLSWGEIESVTQVKCMSLSYLKISSFRDDRPDFMLPCHVTRPEEFHAAISHCASPVNPLRRYVEDGKAMAKRLPSA